MNKKSVKKLLLCLLIVPVFSISCDEKTLSGKYYGRWNTLELEDGEFILTKLDPTSGSLDTIKSSYTLREECGITFITVENRNGIQEKWLALFGNDLLFLFNSTDSTPFFIGSKGSNKKLETLLFNFSEINTSSNLIENGYEYGSKNLSTIALDSPWVEGVHGHGIDEYIDIKEYGSNHLNISSGFISYNKPYLYEYNSRPKRIKIINMESDKEYYFDLKDTPNPQNLYFEEDAYHIRIVIEEVYEGDKWNDTCINSIFFF